MSERRKKAKQKMAETKKTMTPEKNQPKDKTGDKIARLDRFGSYLMDVSKYVLTGVVITSLFKGIQDKGILYFLSIFIVIFTLWSGLVLTRKK